MLRLLLIVLAMVVTKVDQWNQIVVNTQRKYDIRNEGKLYKPLYLDNEESIQADAVIDGDSSKVIRLTTSVLLGDTVVIKLFDNEESFAHAFDILIYKGNYMMRYSREINFTDLVQKFDPVKSKLELSSLNVSDGSDVRGHVEYIGECVSGCTSKKKRVQISGEFTVKIYHK
jgi:hypothetical protein